MVISRNNCSCETCTKYIVKLCPRHSTLKRVYQHIHKTSTNERLSFIFLTVSTKRYVIVLCNMGLKC